MMKRILLGILVVILALAVLGGVGAVAYGVGMRQGLGQTRLFVAPNANGSQVIPPQRGQQNQPGNPFRRVPNQGVNPRVMPFLQARPFQASPKVQIDMKTTVAEKMSKTNRFFRRIDRFVFTVLMIFLVIIIISSSRANIHHDSIDYYAIVQRLTQNSGNPIARNLHFVEQRSPGYPIVSLIPYYLISSLVEPLVQTEEIIASPDLGRCQPK